MDHPAAMWGIDKVGWAAKEGGDREEKGGGSIGYSKSLSLK